ncbi:hypothetical protein BU15DRAFT_76590 [Melanogaster broomeanus]|nr:hypothetical protein BU15DRAFT_76590 [Melanogaster broomeanus]
MALTCLKDLKIDGMREDGIHEVQMFFQRSDRSIISQGHSGHTSRRKPDVIILPFEPIRGSRRYSWKDHIKKRATKKSTTTHWNDVLSVLEFKRSRNKMAPPPKSYVNELQLRRSSRERTQRHSQAISGFGLKRLPQVQADSDSRTSRRAKVEEAKKHVMVQTALYGAEILSANVAVTHTFNFIVQDDVIWIWYYDHQGLISVMRGINFVQDLPRFLVLLYALQRFKWDDWGRNTCFEPHHEGDEITHYTVKVDGKELMLRSNSQEAVTQFGLKGPGTAVMDCRDSELEQGKGKERETGCDKVVKIFWGEEARDTEEQILKRVKEAAEKDEAIRGHVPTLLWSTKFPFSTSTIRKALGFEDHARGSCALFLLEFTKLSPIKELGPDEFFQAWRQCVLCHYSLWKEGIHHRSVSCENLAYHRVDGKVIGVLNGYTLASLVHSCQPLGDERTPAIPFMAIDLLRQDGKDGQVQHRYRHDMESFIWVFIWVSLQYEDGKLRSTGPLDAWAEANGVECLRLKRDFLYAPWPDDLDINTNGHAERFLLFLKEKIHGRSTRNDSRPLDKTLRQLARIQNQTNPSPSRIKRLEEEIKCYEQYVEEPDHVVFRGFMRVVDSDVSRSTISWYSVLVLVFLLLLLVLCFFYIIE